MREWLVLIAGLAMMLVVGRNDGSIFFTAHSAGSAVRLKLRLASGTRAADRLSAADRSKRYGAESAH